MVRRVNTTCAKGKIHHDIRMTGDDIRKSAAELRVYTSLLTHSSFVYCDFNILFLHSFIIPIILLTFASS